MIQRSCQLSKTNSFFLFGARGTGKTTLLHSLFSKKDTLFIDLLNVSQFEEFLFDINRFSALINTKQNKNKKVVIDEVQKMPQLLDLIHAEIQKTKRQFILTGSSSRRLKQKGTNLLAGRAWVYHLYPFSSFEIGKKFNLKSVLEWGALPEVILTKNKQSAKEYLNAYVGTYLEKEIQQEKWVRKLQPFRKFLAIAAQMNGKIINKSKIARDTGLDDVTIANYFEILEDSLLGITLPAFHLSVRKAQKQADKFYFIDTGIKRALSKTLTVELLPQTFAFGEAFEHWFLLEVIKNASYKRKDWTYSYLQTKEGKGIDLVIQRPKDFILIEIKSKDKVSREDVKTLESLSKDIGFKSKKWLVSRDRLDRKLGSCQALYWQSALKKLLSV